MSDNCTRKEYEGEKITTETINLGQFEIDYNTLDDDYTPYLYISLIVGHKKINISLDEDGEFGYFVSDYQSGQTVEFSKEKLHLEDVDEALQVHRAVKLLKSI
jgi:hypothetical protein